MAEGLAGRGEASGGEGPRVREKRGEEGAEEGPEAWARHFVWFVVAVAGRTRWRFLGMKLVRNVGRSGLAEARTFAELTLCTSCAWILQECLCTCTMNKSSVKKQKDLTIQ